MRGNPDVVAVGRLAEAAEDLETLDAYRSTGSPRRAAGAGRARRVAAARRLTTHQLFH
ncbi:hypothetical protein MF672_037595 [Actinomadura sp. ATCC 31491]|uniref:Uncharacterized protein n=1 Tax=Actinomadura luzonensis TaxID=2805427 RepID=A0ABT0G4D6_9ACTN|nr:hypothetical protein [Actinomadura luzonensis]MCK2219470.1 hypothetical protein [Actinomadura luzonensis]